MPETPGIQACMRLNAKLHKRLEILVGALERFAGPTACSGPMTNDENGQPFTPATMESVRLAHAKSCLRCAARKALEDYHGVNIHPEDSGVYTEQRLAQMAGEYERLYMSILGPELVKRRKEQDASHGGPNHDDTHTPEDWCRFIQDYAYRARIATVNPSEVNESHEFLPSTSGDWVHGRLEYEDRMFDVAGLAISAILSSRRKAR